MTGYFNFPFFIFFKYYYFGFMHKYSWIIFFLYVILMVLTSQTSNITIANTKK